MAGLPFSSLICSVMARAGRASNRTRISLRNPTSVPLLSGIELQHGGTLAAVAAVDFENHVFQPKTRQAPGHGRLVVDGDVGPLLPCIGGGELIGVPASRST